MKIFFSIFLLFLCRFSFSQYAIIKDKDGYVNVRTEPRTGSATVMKLENNWPIYVEDHSGNWEYISFTKKGKEYNGYVYADRLKNVYDFKKIGVAKQSNSETKLQADSVSVIASVKSFNKKGRKISYYKDNGTMIEKIDGKRYLGTDGEIPKTEYNSIVCIIGKRKVILPPATLENLFEPELHSLEANYDAANDILYIQTMNGDGAGSYQALWVIEKGKYKDRLIAYGF